MGIERSFVVRVVIVRGPKKVGDPRRSLAGQGKYIQPVDNDLIGEHRDTYFVCNHAAIGISVCVCVCAYTYIHKILKHKNSNFKHNNAHL